MRPDAVATPLLRRVRQGVRRQPLVRAPYKVVKRVGIGDALLRLTMEACERLPDSMDHAGEMWMAAHTYMDRLAQRELLQPDGRLMRSARDHLAAIGEEADGEDHAHCTHPLTPEEEIDARMAEAWLDHRLDDMDDRRRAVVRNGLGLDGPARTYESMAEQLSVSKQRVAQIMIQTASELQAAWRSEYRKAAFTLEFGDEIPEQLAPYVKPEAPAPQPRPVRKPLTGIPTTATKRVRIEKVTLVDGVMTAYGMRIVRTGHDAYMIDGVGPVTPDHVAQAILGRIGPDLHERQTKRLAVARRDTAIGDAMRWIIDGAAWPTPVRDRILLAIAPGDHRK